MPELFYVQEVSWGTHHAILAAIRRSVFIEEQLVSEADEWDDRDQEAIHLLAFERQQGEAVGTARLLQSGKLTRMAVLRKRRRQGIGSLLLTASVGCARSLGLPNLTLDAQLTAVGFYQRHGFKQYGTQFRDAGLPHIAMSKRIEEGV